MMLLGYDTENPAAATAALILHAVYASRETGKLKVDVDFWSRIERFSKSSAKRATTLAELVERLKRRLGCASVRPIGFEDDGRRVFLTDVLVRPLADPDAVLRTMYRETSLCVLLVRERIERDKAIPVDADEADDVEIPAAREVPRKPRRAGMPATTDRDLFAVS